MTANNNNCFGKMYYEVCAVLPTLYSRAISAALDSVTALMYGGGDLMTSRCADVPTSAVVASKSSNQSSVSNETSEKVSKNCKMHSKQLLFIDYIRPAKA